MFISIVFNEEYLDISSRSFFYLKNLLHCYENKWILITHEYMYTNFDKIESNINERFFREFEMRHFSCEEVKKVEQYYIPDSFFDNLEKRCGSRTEFQTLLSQQRCLEFEVYLQQIINKIKIKHPNEKIDGVFNCLESWESVRYICKTNNLPLISYVFSAIRKPHGYQQTLYSANFDRLYCSDECENRYRSYINNNKHCPQLTNQNILALIGKYRNLPLIKHLNAPPTKEINICGEGFSMLPHIYERTHYNDEDIYYECNKLYKKSEMGNRQHPIHLNSIQIDRTEIHNDPAAWILGAKRLVAVCSQIILKAMLWNRTPIMIKNTLPFSFICEKDYSSETKPSNHFLNYYIFGYLIPTDLMFCDSYWKWRLTKPNEYEIYERHLKYICSILNVDYEQLINLNDKEQLEMLLSVRNCDRQLTKYLLSNDKNYPTINFDIALCRFCINGVSFWRLNEKMKDSYLSTIEIENVASNSIEFYPLDDIAGFVNIINIKVNGINSNNNYNKYIFYPKVTGHISIPITEGRNIKIECIWNYKKIIDGLQ